MNQTNTTVKIKTIIANVAKHVITIIAIVVAASIIFIAGLLFGKSEVAPENGQLWTTQEITIGFNQDNGFMVYNHKTKRLDIYSKELGEFLFTSYSKQLYKEGK